MHVPCVFVDKKTIGKNDGYIGIGRERIHTFFEKGRSGDVVAFGNPDVFSPGQFKTFFPLYKSRAAVFLVIDDVGYFGVVSIRFDNFPAVVGRTIVENDDFIVTVSLVQYRIYALIQKPGMTIVGNDYRNIHIESVKKDFTAKIQKIVCPGFLSLFFVRIFAALDNQRKGMISIIVCSINPDAAEKLKQNIAATIGRVEYEVIVFDNRTSGYGICKVYNSCADKSRYDFLCFLHEDVQFDTIGWGEKIVRKLSEPDCGTIGFAGSKLRTEGFYGIGLATEGTWRSNYIQHLNGRWYVGTFENPDCSEFSPVVVLDGMCLFVSRKVWSEIRFDEQKFPGFHLYDLDFSTAVFAAGYVNYVCHTAIVEHFSEGFYTSTWFEATRDYNGKWAEKLPLYVADCRPTGEMKEYVRRVEFRFIKNMMKGRGKCSWEVIGQLCDAYCAKYGGIKAWEMRYQERRYHKRWKRDGRL